MLFILEVMSGTPAYYFETIHKVLLVIGLVVVVSVLMVWRIVLVRRRGRRGGR
jgi:hypothetical protein